METTDIVLKNDPDIIIQDLFDFIKSQEFKNFISLSKLRILAHEKYFNKLKDYNDEDLNYFINTIKEFNFYDRTNYSYVDDFIRTNVINFRNELLIDINKEIKKNLTVIELNRHISPPVEVYEKIGHSKINIKEPKDGFISVFE